MKHTASQSSNKCMPFHPDTAHWAKNDVDIKSVIQKLRLVMLGCLEDK